MRRLNEAWAVLGDPARAAPTTPALASPVGDAGPAVPGRPASPPPRAVRPDFVPYDDSDDTDYAALLDDGPPGNGATPAPGRAAGCRPCCSAAAIFCLSAGLVTSLGPAARPRA